MSTKSNVTWDQGFNRFRFQTQRDGYSTSMPLNAGGNRQRLLDNAIQYALGRPCLAKETKREADEARRAAAEDMARAELEMLRAAVARLKGDGTSDNEDATRA